MNASEMSKMIRAKKKKLMEDQEAIDMSNKHMDGTDIYVEKMKEEGEMLNENHPKLESHDDVNPESEMNEEHDEQSSSEDSTMSKENELKNLRMKRMSRAKSIMSKMK